jgi:hypothetical protein
LAVEAVAPGGARERAWSLARAVPVWAWLVGLVVLSTGIRYAFTRQTVAPWIFVDELIYSELAKSFAAGGHFLVRDHATGSYGYVYPILIAPAWAAFKAVPDAYAAAKGINALVMSLAAVPAYFIARRILGQWLSLAAAALAVAIPSMVYTSTLMTENAFYPIFLTFVLVLVVWLERPSVGNTLLLLGLVLLAYLTRQQAIALVPAILTAPLLVVGREALRRYALMYWIVLGAALLVVIEQLARGRSVFGILGAYQVASTSHYSVGEVTRWFLYHVSELDLSLGVLPFAALLVLAFGLRGLGRPQKIFVAAAVSVSFWLVLEVAVFASEQSFRVEERNMFYVAPLFLIALLVWIDRGLPRRAAVLALHRPERHLGHDRAAPARMAGRAGARPRRRGARGGLHRGGRGDAVPVRAAPVRARAARARARLLRRVAGRDRVQAPPAVARVALRRHLLAALAPRLDRPQGRLEHEGGRGVDGEHGQAHDLGQRALQPQRRHDLPHRRGAARRFGADARDGQPRDG